MRGLTLTFLAALLLAGPAVAREGGPLNKRVLDLVEPLLAGNATRCGPAYEPLFATLDEPKFDKLPVETRRKVLAAAVACSRKSVTVRAAALIRRLEPLADTPKAIADANEVLMDDADVRDDYPEAARRMIRVIDADPARVAKWWPRYITPIAYGKGVSDDNALELGLFKRLTTLTWTDKESRLAAANGWAAHYADLLVDKGDTAGAAGALAGMENTSLWIAVAQDGRYATLWPAFAAEGRFDWRKNTEQELARTLARRDESPQMLNEAFAAMQLLRQLQRYDEAIAMGQSYRDRIKAGETFKDMDRYGNWILNELAYALLDKGKTADAEEVFLESIEIGERGAPSVSQRINWADKLDVLGRPREAIAILESLPSKGMSPYGKMWNDSEMVCALSQSGGAGVAELIAGMQARWADNPAALTQALICANRLDEAAALYIRRLQSPEHRKGALQAFRVVLPAPFLTPRQVDLERRRKTVIARPDVQTALKAAGRAIDLPLAGDYWGAI